MTTDSKLGYCDVFCRSFMKNGDGGMFDIDQKMDRGFYIAGWCTIAAFALLWCVQRLTGIHILRMFPPCMLHVLTGFYCPGCGGTRAVIALFRGDLLSSFRYHPFVPYAALLCGWFMISQTVERITRGRLRIGLHYRAVYAWIALAVIFINVVVKNVALLFGVDLLR